MEINPKKELERTYFVYSPQITERDYLDVVNLLKRNGYTQGGGTTDYQGFRGMYQYFNISYGDFIIQGSSAGRQIDISDVYKAFGVTYNFSQEVRINRETIYEEGRYYASLGESGDLSPIVFKRSDGKNCPFMNLRSNIFSEGTACCENLYVKIRSATYFESKHLDACTVAGKFVPSEKVKWFLNLAKDDIVTCKTPYNSLDAGEPYRIYHKQDFEISLWSKGIHPSKLDVPFRFFIENFTSEKSEAKPAFPTKKWYNELEKGDPVVVISTWYSGVSANTMYPFVSFQKTSYDEYIRIITDDGSTAAGAVTRFRPCTENEKAYFKEHYQKFGVPITPFMEESPLVRARREYPKGTLYYAAHLHASVDTICIVENPDNFYLIENDVHESSGNPTKNGHGYSEVLFTNGKWAVKASPEHHLEYVRQKYPVGTFFRSVGIHIGEVFRVRKPIQYEHSGYTHPEIGYVQKQLDWAEKINESDICIYYERSIDANVVLNDLGFPERNVLPPQGYIILSSGTIFEVKPNHPVVLKAAHWRSRYMIRTTVTPSSSREVAPSPPPEQVLVSSIPVSEKQVSNLVIKKPKKIEVILPRTKKISLDLTIKNSKK